MQRYAHTLLHARIEYALRGAAARLHEDFHYLKAMDKMIRFKHECLSKIVKVRTEDSIGSIFLTQRDPWRLYEACTLALCALSDANTILLRGRLAPRDFRPTRILA